MHLNYQVVEVAVPTGGLTLLGSCSPLHRIDKVNGRYHDHFLSRFPHAWITALVNQLGLCELKLEVKWGLISIQPSHHS